MMRNAAGRRTLRSLALLSVPLLVLTPGCLAPATLVTPMGVSAFEATAGAYLKGKLVVAERDRMERVIAATEAALTDLIFSVTDKKLEENSATIFSRTSDGTSIRIEVERMSPLVSKISIRVGMLGDHPLSQLIMANIQRRLSEARENPASLTVPEAPAPAAEPAAPPDPSLTRDRPPYG